MSGPDSSFGEKQIEGDHSSTLERLTFITIIVYSTCLSAFKKVFGEMQLVVNSKAFYFYITLHFFLLGIYDA